jgi:hypothetical protein
MLEKCATLEGAEILAGLTEEQIDEAYNGIGADWMPECLRDRISKIWHIFEPAAVVHDCQCRYEQDRSIDNFHFRNRQYLNNCIKLVRDEYPWWHYKRYVFLRSADLMYDILEDYGWLAWKAR